MSSRKAGVSGGGKSSTLGAVILAGGKSSRLKVNKVFLKIRCEPLISEVVRVASDVTESIVVAIGSRDDEDEFAAILPGRVKIVKDTAEEKAALYGVFTGLQAAETDFTAVLASDLPFVDSEVIRMLSREAQDFDLAIPKWPNGDIEPLYAVYRVSAARKAFGDAIKAGGVRIRDAINLLEKVNYVPVERFLQVDKALRCFINVNTAADLERIKTMLCDEPSS